MRFAVLLLAGCFDLPDYSTPTKGAAGAMAVELCKQSPDLPCGWVYDCGSPIIELCLPWDDRAEIPHLKETAESQFGSCELSRHPRFTGTPLCKYQCPAPAPGCNTLAPGGCYCLDEAP